MQPVHFYARDLPSATGTLERRLRVRENALERVGDVDARAHGAIEGAGQVLAVVHDASALFRVLLVYAVTRFIGRVTTVVKYEVGAVAAQVYVDLGAGARTLAQAPFAAGAPRASLLLLGARGGAHDGRLADARLEGARRRHVDGHRQIHERNAAQHGRHLAHADGAADAGVLGWNHQVLHGNLLPHGGFFLESTCLEHGPLVSSAEKVGQICC